MSRVATSKLLENVGELKKSKLINKDLHLSTNAKSRFADEEEEEEG
ncbi:hypothetical protein ABEW05_004704 [Botrytis cinerea]